MPVRILSVCFIFMLVSQLSCSQKSDPFFALRNRMVETQIKARGISDEKVLQAFRNLERHKFVLPQYIPHAYADSPLPIDEGQTISQPYIVAFMTDALDLQRTDKVLEIGTGSGYQAAILAELCDSVFTIEIFEKLGRKARELFDELGYENIYTKIGDGFKGWPEHAPFDAIIVTAAPSDIPEPLKMQLAEGGRMIIPVGGDAVQELVLLKKRKGKLREESVLPVRFVPLIDPEGKKY
ncbi:protein-L-isoaspartate(D-aspartate) O-methyltransferase [Mariniphaga sp.]|uniref:protein-L-isoaspartate(D-aspartate) O-methyltransferase n=1 Tax=Mariniphaga sp. TaxID=1954475 RepID=UPI00356249F4